MCADVANLADEREPAGENGGPHMEFIGNFDLHGIGYPLEEVHHRTERENLHYRPDRRQVLEAVFLFGVGDERFVL